MQAQDLALFKAALGLSDPWQVVSVEFDAEAKRLDLRVDFPKGSVFCCPECGREGLKARDTEEKTWRHLDFFQQCAARRLVVSPAQPAGTLREVLGPMAYPEPKGERDISMLGNRRSRPGVRGEASWDPCDMAKA